MYCCLSFLYFVSFFSDEDRVRNDDLLPLSVTTSQCFIFVTDYDEDSTLLTTSAKQIASESAVTFT